MKTRLLTLCLCAFAPLCLAGPIEIPANAGTRLAALEAGAAIPELTINNGVVRTNLTVNGVINGPFTIATTNVAAGTLPGGVKAAATNLNGTVPISSMASGYAAADIAAGDLAGGVRASGTNLNGNVPATQIADGDLAGGVRASATNLNGLVPVGSVAGTAVTQGQVYASATITLGTIAADQLITTNSFQAKDIAGNDYTENTLMRFWLSSAASALSVEDGVIVETVVDKQNYWIVATNAGAAIIKITEAAINTNTLSVSVGPRVSSDDIELFGP